MSKKTDEIKIPLMNIREFREAGYLQEVNRLFFHPHGLALEVVCDEDGTEILGGIWDYRTDPEGVWFDFASRDEAGQEEAWDKYQSVLTEREFHTEHRSKMLSEHYGQPCGDIEPIIKKEENGEQGQQERTVS